MASPESIPSNITALFEKFRDKKVKAKEATELARWIISMQKVPSFNLKSLVMDGYEYTTTDWNRLKQTISRLKKRLEISAKDAIKEHEVADFAVFIENLWKEAKSIATDTVMQWRNRAIEYGYFDKEKEKVLMKNFIEDACNFFVEYKDLLETIEDRIKDTEAACAMFAELSKPQVLRIVALRSYMQFINQITILAARGIPTPESIILEVKNTVNDVILSTHQPGKEIPYFE